MSTHNIGFYEDLSINIKYPQIRTLSVLLQPFLLISHQNKLSVIWENVSFGIWDQVKFKQVGLAAGTSYNTKSI